MASPCWIIFHCLDISQGLLVASKSLQLRTKLLYTTTCRFLCGHHPSFWAEATLFRGSAQLMTGHEKGTRDWAFVPSAKLPWWALLALEHPVKLTKALSDLHGGLRFNLPNSSFSSLFFPGFSPQSITCMSSAISVCFPKDPTDKLFLWNQSTIHPILSIIMTLFLSSGWLHGPYLVSMFPLLSLYDPAPTQLPLTFYKHKPYGVVTSLLKALQLGFQSNPFPSPGL